MKQHLSTPENIRKFKVYLTVSLFFVTVGAALFPLYGTSQEEARTAADPRPAATLAADTAAREPQRRVYANLTAELEALSSRFHGKAGIYVKDLKTGETVSLNGDKPFPSASLVKLPIMAACYQADREGRLRLTDRIALKNKHKIPDCSRLFGMPVGTQFTVHDLIERMVRESDNTATNMLVDALGFGYMNQTFVGFGLRQTDLRRDVMDLKWRRALENYTTAAEMGLLLDKIYRGELVSREASEGMLAVLRGQKVNDRIPKGLPPHTEVAHKTGLLRGTVSDCGIVFSREGDFIICVLTDRIPSYQDGKKFISTVAACTYSTYQNRELADADQTSL